MFCYLCKDAGRGNQPAHRILAGGKGVCNDHLSAMIDPASVCAVSVIAAPPALKSHSRPAPSGRNPSVDEKENAMPKKIEIDLVVLKRDYEQGLRWPELEKKHGARKAALIKRLKAAGASMRGRGEWPRSAMAGNGHKPRSAASSSLRKRGSTVGPRLRGDDKTGASVVTLCLTEAALDALWSGLALDKKAQLIESLT